MPERKDCDLYWTVDVGGYRQLFVDNLVVARLEKCVKRTHAFEKFGDGPVIKPEYDWEQFGCEGPVLYDGRDGRFKCWYLPICSDATNDSLIPGTCYAESDDGVTWRKPMLDLFTWKGEKSNLVLMGGFPDKKPGTMTEMIHSVITRPDEEREDHRFRAMMFRCGRVNEYQGAMFGYYTAHSPDGIHWTINPDPALSRQRDDPELSDAFSFMYDSLKKRYICFTKKVRRCPDGIGDQGFNKRVRGISFSDDFVHWTRPETMLLPDDADDPDVNLYNVGGFVYEGQYLGLLEIYHSGLEGPKARTTDLQLISSRDGQTWWRAGGRATVLACGAAGAWDRGGVYTIGNPIIHGPDGRLWHYYVGLSLHHIPPEMGYFPDDASYRGMGLARLRRDGFVSVDAGEEEGTILTKRLRFAGSKLHVNAEVRPGGTIKAEVYATRHEPGHPGEKPLGTTLADVIDPFTKEKCVAVNGDQLDAVVNWATEPSLAPYADQLVAIKFHLKNASLYSFWIQ